MLMSLSVKDKEMFRFVNCSPVRWSSEGCCDDAEEALAATLAIDHLLLHSLKTTSRVVSRMSVHLYG
jgi:hypothetical protein